MKVLAIDTTSWSCSLALWEDGHELAYEEKLTERSQAAILPTLTKEVIGHHQIDQIIVNIGPGSFTGIRLGVAFAQGLSMGLSIPLKGMDSFTATYFSLDPLKDVLILVEARRQDVFAQRYVNTVPQEVTSLTRQDIQEILDQSPDLPIAGSGTASFLDGIPFQTVSSHWSGAQALACSFFHESAPTKDPLPFYAREADVTYGTYSTNI